MSSQLENFLGTGELLIMLSPPCKIKYSVYTGPNTDGDISWMLKQDKYKNSLFLFCVNEEHKFRQLTKVTLNSKDSIHYHGIVTGNLKSFEGYTVLDEKTKKKIDSNIISLKTLISINENYDKIILPWDSHNRTLRATVYNPVKEVKDYIVNEIRKVVCHC